MKSRRQTLGVVVLTYLLSIITIEIFGQNGAADKKIIEIESFKKYEIIKIDNKDDLKSLSDSTTEVTEMINFLRKGKGNLSGKVTENSNTKIGEIKRTYYFNEQSGLFAIIDHVKTTDNKTQKLTYYFGGGQLVNVIDESKNDVTSTINKRQLYDWIRKMFSDQILAK